MSTIYSAVPVNRSRTSVFLREEPEDEEEDDDEDEKKEDEEEDENEEDENEEEGDGYSVMTNVPLRETAMLQDSESFVGVAHPKTIR